MRRVLVLLVVSIAALGAFTSVRAQTARDDPAFEVAVIKPNRSGALEASWRNQPGGRITFTNFPLSYLIRTAFQMRPSRQLLGGPSWLDVERFDITAKAGVEGSQRLNLNQLAAMMRVLLADQCKLAVHKESRETPIYALTLARSDGILGPQLRHTTVDCSTPSARCGGGMTPSPW